MSAGDAGNAVTHVVFDLGGVVFRYRPERRLELFATTSGRSTGEVRKALMHSGYSRQCDAGRLDAEGAYREGIRLLGVRMSFERFRDAWIAAFEPDPDVIALVERLRERVSVAMLTNNSDLVRGGLEHAYPETMELFRPRLFSADTGVLKPDPRLFQTLLDLIGAPPHHVLYIDDEPAYVSAAAALGTAVWQFDSARTLEAELHSRAMLP